MYLIHPERLEVIVIAGLNNIGEGQTAMEIMEEIAEPRLAIEANSWTWTPHPVFCLYGPKYCSLDAPQNCMDWIPPAGFENKRGIMEEVNEGVKRMDIDKKVNYLKLQMEGIRLHLAQEYKEKVCRKAAQLFSGGLADIGDCPLVTVCQKVFEVLSPVKSFQL